MTNIERLNAMASLYNKIPVEQRNALVKRIMKHIEGLVINNICRWPRGYQDDMRQWVYYALIDALNNNNSDNFYSYFISHIMKARGKFKDSRKWFTKLPTLESYIDEETGESKKKMVHAKRWQEPHITSLNAPCSEEGSFELIDLLPSKDGKGPYSDYELDFNVNVGFRSSKHKNEYYINIVKDYIECGSIYKIAPKYKSSHQNIRRILDLYIEKARRKERHLCMAERVLTA